MFLAPHVLYLIIAVWSTGDTCSGVPDPMPVPFVTYDYIEARRIYGLQDHAIFYELDCTRDGQGDCRQRLVTHK